MKMLSAFMAGLVFGIGLIVAGMANPAKVLNFLDIAGNWNPSLMFVMAGAIAIAAIAFRIAAKRRVAASGSGIELPSNLTIDGALIRGNLVFGIGWGLAGICPGPGFVLLGNGEYRALIFVAALFAGLWFAQRIKPYFSR